MTINLSLRSVEESALLSAFKAGLILEQIEQCLLKHDNPVVACSFGKDSLVVLHLVLQIQPEITVVFNNTKCEFPDTLRLKRQPSGWTVGDL